MAKKRDRKSSSAIHEEVTLELTPMIDVTFLILIFFMCTLKFKTLEGKLVSYLPLDKGLSSAQAPVEFEDAEIILKVPKEDNDKKPFERRIIFMRNGSNTPLGECRGVRPDPNNPKMLTFDLVPPDTFEKVREYAQSVRNASEESKSKIHAYSRVPHAYVVRVLDILMAVGFEDISYSGISPGLLKDLQSGAIK